VFVLFALALWAQGKTAAALYPHLGTSLCYLHNVIYGTQSSVIGVAWSLEIEVQFYVLVPLLTLLFAVRNQRLRRLSLVGLTLAILSAQPLLLRHSPRLSLSILAYLQFFLIGFLLADVFLTDWKSAPQRSLYWDLAALAGWPLLFIALRSDTLAHWLFPYLLFFLYFAAFRGLLINRFFSNPWITAIGGMCYSIYLIHYEVISAVGRFTRRISEGSPYWIYLLVQLVVVGSSIVIICGVYFLILEKPCMSCDWPKRLWNHCQSVFEAKRPAPTTAAS
jgi:peptidoglycan/LPS O-acetylase OafA/YrhL